MSFNEVVYQYFRYDEDRKSSIMAVCIVVATIIVPRNEKSFLFIEFPPAISYKT